MKGIVALEAFGILFTVFTLLVAVYPFPLHASCKISWNFDEPCSNVSHTIIDQIKKWTGPEGCKKGGQRCLYKLVSVAGSSIKATHTTPVKKYVDDLTFMFSDVKTGPKGKCVAKGYSKSEVWYALLDSGTNYCNLHNLITGAKLDKIAGYSETTSNSVCTQYSVANCDKY